MNNVFNPEELVEVARASESGYQRGYTQGYSAALDAFSEAVKLGISTGETLRRLNEFFDDRLMRDWRHDAAAAGSPPPVVRLVKEGDE